MPSASLLANRWQCPDGTILQSFHRHDCKFHTDMKTGETCMVDGGLGYYIRLSGNLKDLCVNTESPFEEIREFFHWGHRGKDGKQPLEYVPLLSLTTEHIEAIIETQTHIPDYIQDVFLQELEYRKDEQC